MARYTNEEMKKALKKYTNAIRKKYNVDKIILFGSRARGDYLLDSDVDLIIISKDFEKIDFRKRMGELLEWWDEPVDLEVIGYTPEEFEKKKKQIGIVQTAVAEGIEIK